MWEGMDVSTDLDWEQLEMITDHFAPDFMEIYDEFLIDAPKMLADMSNLLARGEPTSVARAAHQLKGSAANFGFLAVRTPMAELEAEAKAQNLSRAAELVAAATAGFDRCRQAVQARREEQ